VKGTSSSISAALCSAFLLDKARCHGAASGAGYVGIFTRFRKQRDVRGKWYGATINGMRAQRTIQSGLHLRDHLFQESHRASLSQLAFSISVRKRTTKVLARPGPRSGEPKLSGETLWTCG